VTVIAPRARAYLARLGIDEPVARTVDGLERLQRAHLTRVPFDNLDVFAGREVRTDIGWSVPKIVDRGRGGWCYELNGAFAWLLGELGFPVRQLGATVLLTPGGMECGHLALEVALERPYLVDVGFGDSFIRPLPLDDPGPHDGGSGSYRLEFAGEEATRRRAGSRDAARGPPQAAPERCVVRATRSTGRRMDACSPSVVRHAP